MLRLLKNNTARMASAGLAIILTAMLTFLPKTFAESEHLTEMGTTTYNADGSATLERWYQARTSGSFKSFQGWFEPTSSGTEYDQCIDYFLPTYTIEAGSAIPAGANVNIDYNTGEFTISSDSPMDLVEGDEIVKATFTISDELPLNTYRGCGVEMINDYVMFDGTDELEYSTGWVNFVTPVEKNLPQEVEYADKIIIKDSTDDDFVNPLTEATVIGAVSYSSSNESVATVDPVTGEVHIEGDGVTTITALVAPAYNYMDTFASYDLYVGIRPISIVDASVPDKTYDGTLNSEVGMVTLSEAGLVQGVDYTASAIFDDASVGTNKTVEVMVTLSPEASALYALTSDTFLVDNVVISPHTITSDDIFLEYYVTNYDGTEKEPEVTVKIGNFVVDPDEYTVSYRENVDAGTAYATVTAKDGMNIISLADRAFEIIDNRSVLEITGISTSQTITYTGSPVVLEGTLMVGDNTDGITVDDLTTVWYVYINGGWVEAERPTDTGIYMVRYYYDGVNYVGELLVTFEIVEEMPPVVPDEPETPIAVPDTGRFTSSNNKVGGAINVAGVAIISTILGLVLVGKIADRKIAKNKINFDKK